MRMLALLANLALLGSAAHAQIDLLARLEPASLDRFQRKEASVFFDKSLTITFQYTAGETEVRIPVAQVGWPTDWSQYKAIDYTFFASSLEPVAIGFSARGQTKLFITEPLPGIRIRGVIPFDAFTQTREMTPLRPLGFKVWPQRLFSFDRVEEVVFRMRYPNQPSQFTLYNFTLVKDVPKDDIIDRKPLIDRYGQWIAENWPDKAHNDADLRRLWEADRLEGARFPFCPLGGDESRTLRATGFFRTEKIDGRWVLIDPHGHPFYSAGMDLVGWDQGSFATDVTGRRFLFEELPPPGPAWLTPGRHVSFYVANIMKRFGEGWQEKWERHIIARLKDWGFNTIANWSDQDLATRSGMPYVLPLYGWTTRKTFPFPYDFPDVFSKEFEANVDAAAKRQCEPLKNDPNLIGWFIGNEPHWARSFGALKSWPDMLLDDPEPSATKDKLKALLAENPSEAERIKSEFLYTCARQYFETITRAIRKHDPNHLVLGIRFAERPNRRWAEMSALFDVFSINIYSTSFAPDPEMVREYAEVSGRPVMIGEFTAAAPGRGLQGLFYFGHKVRDQAERAKAYRYYVEKAAADPNIIGTHWFQMVDDLPTGRPSDQERLNYGFINVLDLPYPDLVRAARQTHRRLYDLKFGRTQPFSEKPRWN
ncbi:MAG TPA: hypothetical protein PLA43_12205 [Bryobacteraceae bacterium]|nr:hypothetical protein [Bryobacteraceae bacterium]HPU72713.1 hypothetical protein [Bryobacteraceae bacterium]